MIEKLKIVLLAVVSMALIAVVGHDATQEAVAQEGGAKPELVIQNAHVVSSVAFSPDGKLMASGGSWDKTIKLWDVSAGRLIKNLEGHTGSVYCVSFSPNGSVLASGSSDNTVRLWDAKTGRFIRSFKGRTMGIRSISFSPDGTVLAAACYEVVILWDVSTGGLVQILKGEILPNSVAFSPDGTVLACGSAMGVINLRKVKNGKLIKALKGHSQGMIWSVAFSPDGTTLASASMDKTVKLWNVKKGRLLTTLTGHSGWTGVPAVSFNPVDARILASAGGPDKSVKIWDANTGQLIRTLEGHTDNVTSVDFSPDGRVLASGSIDGTVKVWEVGTGRLVRSLENHSQGVMSVFFSTDGRVLATGSGDFTPSGAIKLWDVSKGRAFRLFKGKSGWLKSVSLSPDGRILASGECGQVDEKTRLCVKADVKLWDANTGRLLRTLEGHSTNIVSVAFSPDGKILASGGCERNEKYSCDKSHLKLWDVNTGRLIRNLEGHTYDRKSLKMATVFSVAFSPDGKILASGGWDSTVKLWNVNTGSLIRTLEHTGRQAWINTVAFSPDGRLLASGSMDKTIKIWDVGSGRPLHTLSADMGETFYGTGVASVSFSPDGKVLASGNSDNIVRLWDVNTGQLIRALKGHSADVSTVSFSPAGGGILASGSQDATIKFWDVKTGKLLCTLIPLDEGDWVLYTDEGYFDASTNGKKYIGWTVGMKNYSFEQFYDEFARPGLFSLVVGGQQIAAKKDLRQGFAVPPDVTIVSPKAGQTIDGDKVKVVVQATDTGGGVQDVRLYHKGKLVGRGERGIGGVRTSGKVVTQEFEVTLMEGDNVLRATAYSRDNIEAVPYEVTVRSAIKAKKPNLFIIAIGINKYKNPKYSLRYSKADAEGLIKFFGSQKGKIFEAVYKRTLYDQQATRANIINALKLPTKPEDVVIIYFAGHGVSIEGNYYFLPHEIPDMSDASVKRVGVPQSEIISALRQVNARKVLMLLDTCQAGALVVAMRGADEERAVRLLSKTAGVHVLAASKGMQAAAEIEKLGHGLFTYAILEGIKGKADHNKDKSVRISELLGYVCSEVETVARQYGKEQFPTMDMHGDDFPLAVY